MANANLNKLGQEIFEARYAYPGETKWAERARVIAKTIASAEMVMSNGKGIWRGS